MGFHGHAPFPLGSIFGWFKQSLNQSIGSFSCNPHFALLWSDERSDLLGNVSDHWGMVTYNFFRNNFFGSLIRTWSGAEFVMHYTHFRILWPLDLLWGSRSYYQMLPFYAINFFWAIFSRTLIRACTGSFANVYEGANLEDIKLGQILGSSKDGSWALVDARNFFFWIY